MADKTMLKLSELQKGDFVRFHNVNRYIGWEAAANDHTADVGECGRWSHMGQTVGEVNIAWTYPPKTGNRTPPRLFHFGVDAGGTPYEDPAAWELLSRVGQWPEKPIEKPADEEPVVRKLSRRPRPPQPEETSMAGEAPAPNLQIGVYDLDVTEHLFADSSAYRSFVRELKRAMTQPETVLLSEGETVGLLLSRERMAQHLSSAIEPYLGNPEFVDGLNKLFTQFTP